MADIEAETYATKGEPTVEDWMRFNDGLFTALRGLDASTQATPRYAPLVDVDIHAAEAGVSIPEYFEGIKERVGPLGGAALKLVQSDMDNAWHITVEPVEAEPEGL